jgi:hypothetical protein
MEFVAGLKFCGGGRVLLDFGNGKLQDVHVSMTLGQLAVRGNDSVALIFYAERSGLAAGPSKAAEKKRSIKKLETIEEDDLESTDCECEGQSSESDGERASFGEGECVSAEASEGLQMSWRL